MHKTLLLAVLFPFFVFSQFNNHKKKNLLIEHQRINKEKKAFVKTQIPDKIVTIKNTNFFEKEIIDKWLEYSKAFEYADYKKIASYFSYPLTFSLLENPQIIENKNELIAFYKKIRNNVQEGYKYSALDKSKIIWLTKDVFVVDAIYSRYNNDYKRIFQGRGLYMYKKTNNEWKMFSVSSLPMLKKIQNKNKD